MNRQKMICYLIIAAVPLIFCLIVLAIFSLPLALLVVLLIAVALGVLKRTKPGLFSLFEKPQAASEPEPPKPHLPPTHGGDQKAYMILVGVNASGQLRITINRPHFVIGRSDDCDFSIPNPMVGRRHLFIDYDKTTKQCYVTDQSLNGTFLNSRKLVSGQKTPLKQGDNLQIANTVFSVEYAHY